MFTFGIARQPRGAALVIAMMVMAVLLLAGTTFLTISSTESQIAWNERAATQALLVAEAALARAAAQVSANPSYSGETGIAVPGGTASITVTAAAQQLCETLVAKDVTATGSVAVQGGTAQVQLRATLDKVAYPMRWAAYSTVSNGVVGWMDDPVLGVPVNRTDKEIWLRDGTATDSYHSAVGEYNSTTNFTTNRADGGHLGSNGDAWLNPNVRVRGNLKAGEAMVVESGANVTGARGEGLYTEGFPAVTPVTVPTASLTVAAYGTHHLTAGVVYHFTTMTFGDNSSLTTSGGIVTIYVAGPVVAGNQVTLGAHPATNLRVIVKSDGSDSDFTSFKAGEDFTVHGSLYGRNTDVFLGDRASVFGAVVSRTIAVGPSSNLHYDEAVSNLPLCTGPSGKYTMVRGTWREVIP
jgi:Tfp pilus assembly protein PilX